MEESINSRGDPVKKLHFVAVLGAFLVYGCADSYNPVEPEELASAAQVLPLGKRDRGADVRSLSGETLIVPESDLISVSKKICAAEGGEVYLGGSFRVEGPKPRKIFYHLSITFAPGDLPSDQMITISIDKRSFAVNADVQFGPCGLEFNNPAMLSMHATNIAIVDENFPVRLLYYNEGKWEPMPESEGIYFGKTTGAVFAEGKIPHFSRYAFGRFL